MRSAAIRQVHDTPIISANRAIYFTFTVRCDQSEKIGDRKRRPLFEEMQLIVIPSPTSTDTEETGDASISSQFQLSPFQLIEGLLPLTGHSKEVVVHITAWLRRVFFYSECPWATVKAARVATKHIQAVHTRCGDRKS